LAAGLAAALAGAFVAIAAFGFADALGFAAGLAFAAALAGARRGFAVSPAFGVRAMATSSPLHGSVPHAV
jgi:hypothetical protein